MCGRGLLGKWGPNHAADPIVTRYDPVRDLHQPSAESRDPVSDSEPEPGLDPIQTQARPRTLQMVAIQRRDTGEWAIPGGMVNVGETVSQTVNSNC